MPAMPPTMPWATRSRTAPSGSVRSTSVPSCAKVASIRSIGTVASAKRIQNNAPMIAAKASSPETGWVSTASSRSVRRSCASA